MSWLRLAPPLLALTLIGLPLCAHGQRQPRTQGIESGDYVWNEPSPTVLEALRLKGNIVEGAKLYTERCTGCHLPSGSGLSDGTYPQLAGQHRAVVIKQFLDILEGRRENAIMYRFARGLTEPQKLADLALYIRFLKIPRKNGRGPGHNLERGKELYERDCASCHGASGEGDAEKFFPVVAGQHYEYLLRQIHHIADGRRRNANPEMVEVVRIYSDRDREAVIDYMSRLEWPERQEAP
jgi:cytochrome c553